MSACPQDLTPVNGAAQRPTEVHVQLHREAQKEAQNDG